eukprot:5327532-Prymnesium_polylepis.2
MPNMGPMPNMAGQGGGGCAGGGAEGGAQRGQEAAARARAQGAARGGTLPRLPLRRSDPHPLTRSNEAAVPETP